VLLELLRTVKKVCAIFFYLGASEFIRIVGRQLKNHLGRFVTKGKLTKRDLRRIKSGPMITVIQVGANMQDAYSLRTRKSILAQQYPNCEILSTEMSAVSVRRAVREARGEFFLIMLQGDCLPQDALYHLVLQTIQSPKVDMIYGDEAMLKVDGATVDQTFFKPDWSPEYLLSFFYLGHGVMLRTALAKEVALAQNTDISNIDMLLILRSLARVKSVQHVARITYHHLSRAVRDKNRGLLRMYESTISRKAVSEYLSDKKLKFVISKNDETENFIFKLKSRKAAKISIVIPTANLEAVISGKKENHIDALTQQILRNSTYKNIEVIVVHNNDLSHQQTQRFSHQNKIRLVGYESAQFNLADKINLGASFATGNQLVLMNDDMRLISKDWLELMLAHAERPEIGVVGPRLFYGDMTIQHAGIVMLNRRPGHAFRLLPHGEAGYGLGIASTRNVIAVTGACTMTPRHAFEKLKGYRNIFPLHFNDIDYCLRLLELGYRVVYEPAAKLYHYEGASKHSVSAKFLKEFRVFLDAWPNKFERDPYYNVNLNQREPYAPE